MKPVTVDEQAAYESSPKGGRALARRNRRPFAMLRLLASFVIGIIVFATTHNTMAGVVLPALHVAWAPLRTGLWTLRVDQHDIRRVICFVFYLATSCWHAAAASFASVLVFVGVAMLTGGEPTIECFTATMLTLVAGLTIAMMLVLAASFCALATGVRVWINPKLKDMVEGDFRNVERLPAYPGFNHAVFVLSTSVALPVLALCCYSLAVIVSPTLTLAALTIGPAVAIVAYWILSSRMIAHHPSECWNS